MISTENGSGLSAADVAAVVNRGGGGYGYGGDAFGGNALWWIIVLFLFAFMGGGNWGGFGGNAGGVVPFMMGNNTNSDIQRGFDQQAVMSGLNGLTSTVSNGFANAEVSRCNQLTTILQALATNQASTTQGMNSLALSLQQCCCDNRAAVADLKYTIATENCADRAAVNDGVRDLMAQNTGNTNSMINAMNAGFQGIQDKLCQLELDGVKQNYENQIRTMQTQYNNAIAENQALRLSGQLGAVQSAVIADNTNQTAVLRQALNPTAVPAYVVPNPNGCNCGYNYGCGRAC